MTDPPPRHAGVDGMQRVLKVVPHAVENAGAQATLYRTQLERALIRSPIDGVVLDRKVSTGQTVAAAPTAPKEAVAM